MHTRRLWGERERAIDAFKRMDFEIRAAEAASAAPDVNAYLCTVANVGGTVALNDEPRIDSSAIRNLRAALDWKQLSAGASLAERIVEVLVRRRPTALTGKKYAAKRCDSLSHLYWELARPLAPPSELDEYAKCFGRWLPVTKRTLSAPRLTLARIAELADETYQHSKRTHEDLETAVERVRQRILRFQARCIDTGSS